VRHNWRWLNDLAGDSRYALRQLRRNPGFSAIAIATLALGIGGVTAMFSAFDTILIRPLPYGGADRLVMVWDQLSRERLTKSFPAPAEWLEWRRLNTVFADIAATQPADATLSGESEPEQVPARKATANLWNVLGVNPLLGRVFTEEEDAKGVRVLVMSHGLWQRRPPLRFPARLRRDCDRRLARSPGGRSPGLFRSRPPRLAHRSDDRPAARLAPGDQVP